jgi:F-type H+-transporting ATPase subunit b
MIKLIRLLALACMALLSVAVFAQEKPNTPAPSSEKKTEAQEAEKKAEPNAAAEHKAEGKEAEGEKDEEAQFKESPSVKKLAGWLGLTVSQAFWVSTILNFLVIAGLIVFAMKSNLPTLFRERTSAIQKGIEEARKASAESAAKLQDIESRLSKLDSDIASMKIQAEQDADAEDRRLRAATEEEKKKIIATSEQEIASAANSARRELKQYAAELAVALAEKRITVDEAADKNLVRDFAAHLNDGPAAKGRS